ncbi:hypothetical protein [Burkholderia cenocepacia]|uniref:Uncharacterized protein n=1 Tax=Burkholderia cenocepacia TaxID=95486 RepID=A0ABD4UJL2_9BURK|nr:hypothetical protein [Burkholderia cenocepacia]MCW3699224.1 hypothetical protein [Burkholderia cenocepacia]MCW3704630.1 hypothetical protein [Burkholderia cenocepacia]MCW3714543.1 hypothetical protein [Burkholderia cenocepacia]MCW3720550.1 hypothetical protein [Burkholderia cenocepacia]MCW3720596.1 hypothetical protein [Burkholderia cenocepacia]
MAGIRIPVYNSQVTPALQTSGARTPLTVVDDSTGTALQQAGAAVGQVAGVLETQKRQDEQAAVARQIGDDRVTWLQNMQTAKDNAAPGAPDFTPNLIRGFDDYAQQQLQQMPDGVAKRFYTMQLGDLRTSLAGQAVTWQAEQHRAYNVSQYQQGNDTAARAIAMDPSLYGSTRASQLALIDTAQLDPQTKAKLVDNFKDVASTAAGMRMVSEDPVAALGVMTQKPDQPLPAGYEWVGDLPPQKLVALQGHARTLVAQQQNAADREALQRENDAATAHNQALDLVNSGKQLSPEYTTQLLSATAGTAVAEQTRQLINVASQRAGFASASLPQQAATLQRYQTEASTRGTDPDTAAAVKQLEQIHTASVAAYKADPWNAALDRGVLQGVPQVDTSSVPGLVASLAGRAQAAGAVEAAAGRRVSLMTPAEAQTVLTAVDALPIDTKAQALNQIGQAYGNAGRIADLAAQWKEKSPAMALALKAGAADAGGKPLLTTSGAPLSTFILTGAQALKDKTVKIDDVAGTGMRATIANAIGDSLPPEQADDAKEAAYFIAAGSAARGGRTQPSSTDVQNAISGATGGISTTGGLQINGKPNIVAMPYGWREEDFQSAVKSVTAANIENPGVDTVLANGHEIPVADFVKQFASYRLVRVGVRGTYVVSTGSKFVTDKTGAPVTVHLTFPTKNAQTGTVAAGQSPTMPFPGGM